MSVERFGGARASIAIEAARLMYEEGVKEYFTAKRLAAKRVLGRTEGARARYRPAALPSNGEIREALLHLAELCEGRGRTRKLFAMRVAALEVMRGLLPFAPRLIGSVSTGHVRRGSDIDVQLFEDDPGAIELHLAAQGWAFAIERVTIRKFGEIRDYVHLHGAWPLREERRASFPVELTVYPRRELRFRPRSSTDGLPIDRLGPARLEALLAREHAEAWRRYLGDGVIEGLDAALREAADDTPGGAFDGLLDELDAASRSLLDDEDEAPPCHPEPGEEDDPEQRYDPLPGFD